MNIPPLSSGSVPLPARAEKKGAPSAAASAATDHFSAGEKKKWAAALAEESEIRPEILEKARPLAQDPNYPSTATTSEVARRLLGM